MLTSWSKLDCLHDKDFIFFCQLKAPAKISFWLIWVNSIKCANCTNKMEKLGYLLHRTVQLAENLLQKSFTSPTTQLTYFQACYILILFSTFPMNLTYYAVIVR